jgi:hypothetical protein
MQRISKAISDSVGWIIPVLMIGAIVGVCVVGEGQKQQIMTERRSKVDDANAYIEKYCSKTRIITNQITGRNQTIYICFNETREYEYASIINVFLSKNAKLGAGETVE